MKKKSIRSRRGESMVETLMAMLIIALVFIMLGNTFVAATRGNAAVHPADTAFHSGGEEIPGTVTFGGWPVSGYSVYQTDNDYYYYVND